MTPGNIIGGRYRLVRQLGEGAMGVVWAAVNELTSGEVALKLILKSTDDLRLRLLREARVCGGLKHRNVIEVHDVGQTEEGDPFLVMQLLSGETLASLLKRQRRLDPPVAAQIARDVARALAAAHAAGVIHRDLKPANIFLHHEAGADGPTVKVLDFGVSKSLTMLDGLVTIDGGAVGSPAYMSPEQAMADRTLDHRTDIWSLGVVLFELLTGVRPFQGDSNQVIPRIILGDIPLVSRHVRLIDPGLVALVSLCLERDRARRIGSADELAELLRSHVSRTPSNPDETVAVQELDILLDCDEESDASEARTIALESKPSSARKLPRPSLASANDNTDGEIDLQAPYWWRRVGPSVAPTSMAPVDGPPPFPVRNEAIAAFSVAATPDGTPVPRADPGPGITTMTPQLTSTVLLPASAAAPSTSALDTGAAVSAFRRRLVGTKALLAFAGGCAALLALGIGAYRVQGESAVGAMEARKQERQVQQEHVSEPQPVSSTTAPQRVESPPSPTTAKSVEPAPPVPVKPVVEKKQPPPAGTSDKKKARAIAPGKDKPKWLSW